MAFTAFDAPDNTITSSDVIALAVRCNAASLAERRAWRIYCAHVDAAPDSPADADTAALYAAHIAVADLCQTHYTALLAALQQYIPRVCAVTISGLWHGRWVQVDYNRALNIASVHVSQEAE